MATHLFALVTIRGISFDGGDTYPIQRDSDEWRQWFTSTPQGGKIRFEWLNGSAVEHNFTAYRRKRYWEAQKRVSGKLRNTTIKPEEVTYQKLEQVGYDLIAYNWQSKFEPDDSSQSGKSQSYQTPEQAPGAIAPEVEELKAEAERLKKRESYLLDQLGLVKSQIISEAQQENEQLKKRCTELDNYNWELEKRNTQLDDLYHREHEKCTQVKAELTARIETLTRDQAQHQVAKLKLAQAEQKTERLESLVTDYQTKLERAKLIDLGSLDNPKAKTYQLRGDAVVLVKHLNQLGYQVKPD